MEALWGGIAGNNWGTINRCYNIADILTVSCGGIVAANSNGGKINQCYNGGHIERLGTSNSGYAGGIAGSGSGSNATKSQITNCYNFGTISGEKNIGGIVGYVSSNNQEVENCYNVGKIKGNEHIGGIIRR